MDMSNKEYQDYVKRKAQKSPLLKDTVLSFLIGGGICTIGQAIMAFFLSLGMAQEEASTATTITLVFPPFSPV